MDLGLFLFSFGVVEEKLFGTIIMSFQAEVVSKPESDSYAARESDEGILMRRQKELDRISWNN